MTTVYLVTSGSYSDYGIQGAYSTRELAQAAIDVMERPEMYSDEPRIEEWELDTDIDHYARGEAFYSMLMWEDGTSGTPSVSMWGEESTEVHVNSAGSKFLFVGRWAKNSEEIVKIANEIRTQKIALGEW